MGRNLWGSNGGYQGKNGANIGRWVNGRYEIGPLPHPTNIPPTSFQLDQRAKFGMMTSWLRTLKGIIRTGYNIRKPRQSAWNAAVSYNLDYAVTGVAPNFSINYPEVKFCKGELTTASSYQVTVLADQELKFEWETWYNAGYGAETDQLTLVIYNLSKQLFVLLTNAANRSAGTYTMQLPASFSGDEVQCYMSFLSADGKTSSDSMYITAITVV